MSLHVSRRELKKAWQSASKAYTDASNKTNAHRLLLFYAVETGLKAVYLRQNNWEDTRPSDVTSLGHDLNALLDKLRTGSHLKIDTHIKINDLKSPKYSRKSTASKELNQVWRYGASSNQPKDVELEEKLNLINNWIMKELL